MKKTVLLITALILFAGLSASAKLVEIEKAKQAGKNFYFARLNKNLLQSVAYNELKISNAFIEKAGDVPVYYTFNFTGKGYIIVSADDGCYPVIGYSFDSQYNPESQSENFVYWMSSRKQEIMNNIQNNILPDLAISDEWNRLSSKDPMENTDGQSAVMDVAPLLNSTWDQGFPYNVLCPAEPTCGSFGGHVTVGCVATAMAQIMYYWRWPLTGTGSHCYYPPAGYGQQCADFGNTTYDWNGMTDAPTSECAPIALISYHAGVSVNMMYNDDGACSSGSYQNTVPAALINYFRYASSCMSANKMSYSITAWNNLLQGDLGAGKPVQYGGQGAGGGHSWVCDGYQGADFYHMNWGWSGSDNGYFYLNNLNPAGFTFNNSQSAVFHIEPNTSMYPSYCNGSTILSTYDFGSIEDGSGPVSYYQDNTSCNWLIQPDDSVATITLSFTQFKTATGDVVKVYDGANASATLIGTYTGALTSMPSVTSTGPKMFITFTTDGSGTEQGWKAKYTSNLVKFCASNTTLLDGWGTITDGSDRFDYRNSSNCKWKIMPVGCTKLVLTPTSFNTEANSDKLQVYDLGTSALLATWSGAELPSPIESTTGAVMLIWSTNGSVRGAGWEISYSPMVGIENASVFTDLSVYPNPASGWINIAFTITEPQNVKVELLSLQGESLCQDNLVYFKGKYENKIDVSSFAKGVYMLRIKSDMGTSVKKIVIQ
ncbi:MAG: C10 family peptidase [Bacteroidetes bacterium]|nr:C10 family peptidase [Bacteroidota bacterium]